MMTKTDANIGARARAYAVTRVRFFARVCMHGNVYSRVRGLQVCGLCVCVHMRWLRVVLIYIVVYVCMFGVCIVRYQIFTSFRRGPTAQNAHVSCAYCLALTDQNALRVVGGIRGG